MIKLFRGISLLEGISYLALFINMLLIKQQSLVFPIGMAHGLLFIAYILFAIMVKFELNWKPKTLMIVFLASVIPFGTFYVDKKYFSKK